MKDYKALIKEIAERISKFNKNIPDVQREMLAELENLLSELNTSRGNVQVSAANLRVIAKIKERLKEVILTDSYKAAVTEYLGGFTEVTSIQNQYFQALVEKFKPNKLSSAIMKQAIVSTTQSLTEAGLEANVIAGVESILNTNITTGGSYSNLQKQLRDYITNNETGEGILERYTKQITTDALNQYSAQHTQLLSNDLGFDWFVYAGSNIETSRPFCLACTQKRYIHASEFPALLDGNFKEFKEFEGRMYKGLPAGMYPGTDVANFPVRRGGYNCGHQLRPISDITVPTEIKAAIENTAAFKAWNRNS